MNRTSKKFKSDCTKGGSANNSGSRIHSGHYMTSSLHDQSEDTVEMPIASPDATNNDVTLNTNLNSDQEHYVYHEPEVPHQSKASHKKNTSSSIRKIASGPFAKIQAMISSNGSISGGLTLDKNNKSLKNLMFYIKSAYSNNLTSPKWKNFKGLKLQVTEKIRLNNVIWRSWFEQCGKKDQPNMKLRLICQFANGLDEKAPMQKMSKKEEKYWKARLESITNEYKKWREISRKQIKPNCDIGENLIPINGYTQSGSDSSSTQQLSSSLNETHYFDGTMNYNSNYQVQPNYVYSNNYSNVNEYNHSEFNVTVPNDSNFNSFGPNTPQNINSFGQYSLNSNYTTSNYSGNAVGGYSPNVPIASKQMQFNNRCRSPSPGLFDFDLNNFSSDTLFSTHLNEDPKDTIFGTNPDLFQPDLMHLFPNFDFFDLPGNSSDVFNFADTNSEQSSPQSSNPQIGSDGIQPVQIQTYNHQSSESVVDADEVNKQNISMTINYSDLSNFNTLATVAAAQSISPGSNTSPQNNRPFRQRHMSDIGDFNHLKNSSDQGLSNNVNNPIKMPTSLSQINSNLSLNSMQYPLANNNVPNQNVQNVRRSSGPQVQNSSNTIRNLLALNTPTIPMPASISPPKQTNSNMRISGMLGASGSTVPSIRKQSVPQKLIYQDSMSTGLTSNTQNSSLLIVPSETKAKTDNLSISNLLNSNIIVAQTEAPTSQIMNQQEQFIDQAKPPPSKRGRKNAESSNSRSNSKAKSAMQNKARVEENGQPASQINGLIISDSIESLSSASPSPSQKFSSYNTFPVQNKSYQNTDCHYGDYASKFKTGSYSAPQDMSFSSKLNRSDSLNSVNTESANMSTAEQKRRCNIQQGFDRLQILVPALKDGKSLKVSKAVMLQKTSEYIKELQLAREKRMSDLDVFKKEIDELSDKIAECQNQLPVSGVSVIGNLNKTEIFEQKFNTYVKDKAMANWKFYLFSLILKPLFDNFIQIVNTSSKEDMERTFMEWQGRFCSLAQLRPTASNALRSLSRSTSVLTDPAKLPEECITAALSKI